MTDFVGARGVPRMPLATNDGTRTRRWGHVALPAIALAAALGVAACSGSATPVPAATPAPTAAAAATTQVAGVAAAGPVTLTDAKGGPQGDYIADAKGMALYVFTQDTGPTSACYGGCAKAWPPLLTTNASTITLGAGVSGAAAITGRTDGSEQVTLNGVPLYFFAKDAKPGDVNGQGVGGTWFLVSPTGATGAFPTAAVTPAPAATAAAAAGSPVELASAKGGPKGTYLADGKGMALYTYAKDTGSTSTCDGGCASYWPPLIATDAASVTEATGVTGKIALTKRTDGTEQVTYNGAPLYYYGGDTKAGDVTGDGSQGVWFVAKP